MKVLIIGAGAVGSVIARLLAKEKEVERVVAADRDPGKAREFLGGERKKISLVPVDATKVAGIARTARGADLVINASLPQFNLNVMRAALRVGAHYQDLDSHFPDRKNPEQFRLTGEFRKRKRVALITAGVSPGITNVLARDAAERFHAVERIRIRLLEEQQASQLIFAWSPTVSLDELTSPPLVYRNGHFAVSQPFSDPEEYEFPQPIGKRTVVTIFGDEVVTLPRYIDVREVDYKSSGMDIDFAQALYRLGLFRTRPVTFQGRKIVPLEFFATLAPPAPTPKRLLQLMRQRSLRNAQLIIAVETVGRVDDQRMKVKSTAFLPDLKAITRKFPGATYISYPTGVAAAAFAKVIPWLARYGVYPPEALGKEDRARVLLDLRQHDVVFEERLSKARGTT